MNCSSIKCVECGNCKENDKQVAPTANRAVRCFGYIAQTLQTAEKCTELATELIKVGNDRGNRENLLDEYVDVFYVMAPQMKLIMRDLGFTEEEILIHAARKIAKLEMVLAEEGYGCI